MLPNRADDISDHERRQRLTGIAADLENGLREALAFASRHMGYTRRFGMQHRGTDANECG
ncbi:hypothetical protein D3C86_2170020 [compost metagenome]